MRKWQVAAIAVGVLLAGLGAVMAATNPDQQAYESFATEALIDYGGKKLCPKVPFLGQSQCQSLLQSNKKEIRRFVTEGTQRHDFFLFSIYKTNLSIHPLLPSYEFGTVGAFQQFYVYKAKQM
jgi:uncharacterized protein YceK